MTKDDHYCFVNLDGILGYEIGELTTGKHNSRVEVGKYVYPSSGDVIEAASKKIVAKIIESEKLLEIQFENGKVVRVGTR